MLPKPTHIPQSVGVCGVGDCGIKKGQRRKLKANSTHLQIFASKVSSVAVPQRLPANTLQYFVLALRNQAIDHIVGSVAGRFSGWQKLNDALHFIATG